MRRGGGKGKTIYNDQGILFVKYDQDGKFPTYVNVPLPPWDFDTSQDGKPRHNSMTLSLTITEIGNVPWLLDKASKIFDKNKDSIANDLANSLKSKANLQ